MLRVLMINGGPLDYGGISSCILNYAGHIDPGRIMFDHAVHGYETGSREEEVLAGGSVVFHLPHRRRDPFGNRKALRELFLSGRYSIVHSHLDGMNGYVLDIAKQCGIPVRIAHCHNTDHLTTDPFRRALHSMQARRTPRVATDLFACSESAASFFYGKESGRAVILKNAIEAERFSFREEVRTRLRRELGIGEDTFLIGHIGRFEHQKNHFFLIDVFERFTHVCPDSRLMLIGDGALREEMESKAKGLGMERMILFAGYRQDVADCYSAFDCFALPSLFEGFGMVLLEAQSSGLRCITSEYVPEDACLDRCGRLPLTVSAWVEALAALSDQRNADRGAEGSLSRLHIAEKGYDIRNAAEKLALFYERRLS